MGIRLVKGDFPGPELTIGCLAFVPLQPPIKGIMELDGEGSPGLLIGKSVSGTLRRAYYSAVGQGGDMVVAVRELREGVQRRDRGMHAY